MKKIGTVAVLAAFMLCIGAAAIADYGEYFWVVKGHDVAGTGRVHTGITPYFSAEDWVVGTQAYVGPGGPDAVRKLPCGANAPLGRTPTERTGSVRVALGAPSVMSAGTPVAPPTRMAAADPRREPVTDTPRTLLTVKPSDTVRRVALVTSD